MTDLTPAEIRLGQYADRSTWTTATYGSGNEKALHEIALGLKAEIDRLRGGNADARAQALRDAAEICDEAGAVYGSRGANDAAGAAFALMERFQRKANEAEYVATPCDLMNPCEDGGEPCHVHERLMAHADGEHELCGPDCTAP